MEGLGVDFAHTKMQFFFMVIEKNPVSSRRKDE